MTSVTVEETLTYRSTCGALTQHGLGPPCKQRAGHRTDHPGFGHCWIHSGRSPMGRKHGLRARAEAIAREALTALGQPLEIEPAQALLELVYEAAGNVAFLSGEVSRLQPGGLTSRDVEEREEIAAIVRLYGEERDRLAKYSKVALDAGIDERRVRLSERQGDAIMFTLRAVLDALQLTPAQVKVAHAVAASALRDRAQLQLDTSQLKSANDSSTAKKTK